MMYAFVKRFFDALFAIFLIVLISPALIIIVILLKLTGEGEVFYFQERIGLKNKKFNIWKFATMLKDSPNLPGGIITVKNDARITKVGGFLRKTKINELPQLINILLGDMSFVGPRPVMEKSYLAYPEKVRKSIYNVKPGLTGIGSVVFRNEEALITKVDESGGDTWTFYKEKIYPYKGELELWYQDNQSFIIDFKILIATAIVVIFSNFDITRYLFKNLPEKEF